MRVKCTRLCYWIAQFSNTCRVRFTLILHTPMHSHCYHIHIVYKWNWDGSCLMNLTQKVTHSYIFFKFAIALLSLGETFKGTRHGIGVAVGAVAKLLWLWQHASALLRHPVWICSVTSHNAWMEYSLPNLNCPRVIHKHILPPSKQWGVCDNK